MFVGKIKVFFDYFEFIVLPFLSTIMVFSSIGWVLVYCGVKEMPDNIDYQDLFGSFVVLICGFTLLLILYNIYQWRYMFKKYGKKRHIEPKE